MSAASALFLSVLVIIAIWRQKTHKVFQKHVLLFAIVSNVLITIYVTQPGQSDPDALKQGIILSKRVQATFDYLFSITIGAWIVLATTPSITTRKDFAKYMSDEFPNSYIFYVFIMAMALASIAITSPTVTSTQPTTLSFEPYFLFVNGFAVGTLMLYAPFRFVSHLRKTNPGEIGRA